jgi:glutamate/tyrosine decarboxylase-like PLP-dependent enzyme
VHEFNDEVAQLAQEALAYALHRLRDNPPLDHPKSAEELFALAGNTITKSGLGGSKTLQLFKDVLAPSCLSTDHPAYLAFIPSAPSEHSILFDLVVGASALYGGSWLEGAGAVFAENQALAWLAGLANLPESAGGVFVQGGTIGNLSALVTARSAAKARGQKPDRWVVVASAEAHSSIASATDVMDVELLLVEPGSDLILRGADVQAAIDQYLLQNPGHEICAIVATAGSTNLGIVDDLRAIGEFAKSRGYWFHVDGAYGLAALGAPSARSKFNGIELCDSFIVDPHKWLFAPFDACALVYREPALAKRAHTQHAAYLDTLEDESEWNPSDYAIQLTRRPRGLPFWFSLAANGTAEYEVALEETLRLAQVAAELIKAHPNLELLFEPTLSVVAFTRNGWQMPDYQAWSDALLDEQIGFVTPSAHHGAPILRFAIVNPWTAQSDLAAILSTL